MTSHSKACKGCGNCSCAKHAHTTTHSHSEEHHTPFSRASHFALVLIPSLIGVGVIMLREASSPLWFRGLIFFLFLFSLAAGIATLKVLDQVKDYESSH